MFTWNIQTKRLPKQYTETHKDKEKMSCLRHNLNLGHSAYYRQISTNWATELAEVNHTYKEIPLKAKTSTKWPDLVCTCTYSIVYRAYFIHQFSSTRLLAAAQGHPQRTVALAVTYREVGTHVTQLVNNRMELMADGQQEQCLIVSRPKGESGEVPLISQTWLDVRK